MYQWKHFTQEFNLGWKKKRSLEQNVIVSKVQRRLKKEGNTTLDVGSLHVTLPTCFSHSFQFGQFPHIKKQGVFFLPSGTTKTNKRATKKIKGFYSQFSWFTVKSEAFSKATINRKSRSTATGTSWESKLSQFLRLLKTYTGDV